MNSLLFFTSLKWQMANMKFSSKAFHNLQHHSKSSEYENCRKFSASLALVFHKWQSKSVDQFFCFLFCFVLFISTLTLTQQLLPTSITINHICCIWVLLLLFCLFVCLFVAKHFGSMPDRETDRETCVLRCFGQLPTARNYNNDKRHTHTHTHTDTLSLSLLYIEAPAKVLALSKSHA